MYNTIFFVFIAVKITCSNHALNFSVVSFIIFIDPLFITTSSLYGYDEVINKKFGNICLFFQDAILIDSHASACMLFILQCC